MDNKTMKRKILKYIFMGILISLISINTYAKTPSGTVIRNHAVVSFDSLSGDSFEASSNEVLMIVQPVYGISILPDGTQIAPGQTQLGVASMEIIFPYTITFTGNIKDTANIIATLDDPNSTFLPKTSGGITGMVLYNDLNKDSVIDGTDVVVSQWFDDNADGDLDAAEIDSFGLGKSYNPEETANLLLVFTVPAGTPAGREIFFGIDGTSVGDAGETDVGNISEGETVNDAVLTIKKSATPYDSVTAGATVQFDIDIENVGTQSANRRSYTVDGGGEYDGVLLYDIIPQDEDENYLSLAAPAPSGTFSGGTAIIIYSASDPTGDPTGWTWVTAEPPNVKIVGYLTSNGGTDDLLTTETMSLTMTVTAPSTEQIISNTGYINYEDNTGPATQEVESNTVHVPVEVITVVGVDIRDTDFEGTPPPLTPADDGVGVTNDTQTRANAYAGTYIYYTNRVENTGSIEDTYNITTGGVPAGWTIALLKSDGKTPLSDTGFDSILDTGPMKAGTTRDIVIRIEIPEDQATIAVPTNIVLTATSVANDTVDDTTTDIVSAVTEATMNLANNNPNGVVDEATIQKSTSPGSYVDFPLLVENTAPVDGEFDTYIMTSTVPSDWYVIYYRDLNENGILDDAELQPQAETFPVEPQDMAYLIARVFASNDANFDSNTPLTPGIQDPYDIIFTATSTNNGNNDSITDEVIITATDLFQLRPDRSGIIEPGGTTVYLHELQNYGSRPNRFYLQITEGNSSWNYILYDDTMTVLPQDAGKYYIDLDEKNGATDTESFYIKLFAPTNIPVGTIDITTITASARDFGIVETSDVVDITHVVQGDLQLTKDFNPAPGVPVSPGDTIDYTTEFFNKGAKPLSNIKILDAIPAHTEYVLQSGSSSIVGTGITGVTWQKSTDGGITWANDSSGAGADSSVTNVRAVLAGSLLPGTMGSVTFQIQIK